MIIVTQISLNMINRLYPSWLIGIFFMKKCIDNSKINIKKEIKISHSPWLFSTACPFKQNSFREMGFGKVYFSEMDDLGKGFNVHLIKFPSSEMSLRWTSFRQNGFGEIDFGEMNFEWNVPIANHDQHDHYIAESNQKTWFNIELFL